MQRNTSFFWTSDAFRDVDEDFFADSSDNDDDSSDDDEIDHSYEEHDGFVIGEIQPTPTTTRKSHPVAPPPPPPPPPAPIPIPSSTVNDKDNDDEEGQPLLLSTTTTTATTTTKGISSDYGSRQQRQSSGSQPRRRRLFPNTTTATQQPSPVVSSLRRRTTPKSQPTPTTPLTSPKSAWRKRVVANRNVLRLQVVIWYVGQVEVKEGVVDMRFRVTLFWNDDPPVDRKVNASAAKSPDTQQQQQQSASASAQEWNMRGRRLAVRTDWDQEAAVLETVDVPPISILNAVSFDALGGGPEVTMVDAETRLLRWTCMYAARLHQADHIRVDQFPHDAHNLKLKLGILAHRGRGQRWDKAKHPLALATDDDSMGSTRIPHGLVVDHVTIPDFTHDPDGLLFEFLPLQFGAPTPKQQPKTTVDHYHHQHYQQQQQQHCDHFLQVTLPVVRLSGHYDHSIMPMLALLNVVAVTCLPRNFASATASTETMLSIAFVQVGIRLSIDSRLPSVGYQIKMQRVLNQCFWLLCALVVESNVVFVLVTKFDWEVAQTDVYDCWAAVLALLYTAYILVTYYSGRPSLKGLP